MSLCVCGGGGSAEERAANARINNELKKWKGKDNNKIKLLLLGAGESGKSTVAKQIKIIHLKGYSDEAERERFKRLVFSNVVDNTKVLIEAVETFRASDKAFPSIDNMEGARSLFQLSENELQQMEQSGFDTQLGATIDQVWRCEAVQSAYKRRAEFQLNDTAEYFYGELERVMEPNYIPSVSDIVHVRAKTTGINEIDFDIGRYKFSLTDVGGQRNERRKWIHCFEEVTAIIFCAAMSEYDQKLYEDEKTNRMSEALKLFKDITNSKWFLDTPIILFLNKMDLFEKKIAEFPLKNYFPEYQGGDNFEDGSKFIQQLFLSQVQNQGRLIYPYMTCATNTKNIQYIFKAVKDVFVTAYLKQMGLISGGTI